MLFYFPGFHAVDLDSASVNDLFIPSQVSEFSFIPFHCERATEVAIVQIRNKMSTLCFLSAASGRVEHRITLQMTI